MYAAIQWEVRHRVVGARSFLEARRPFVRASATCSMVDTYVNLFGEKPTGKVTSPLEKGDHPELYTSKILYEI